VVVELARRVAACRGDGPTHHAGLCETRAVAGG
jgi:hypothetical protein